jgi:hypothetical protein
VAEHLVLGAGLLGHHSTARFAAFVLDGVAEAERGENERGESEHGSLHEDDLL